MAQRQADEELDFEVLRLGIERCDPDMMLHLYAEDAELGIFHAGSPQSSRFELRGKAEIAKHLRTVLGRETSHRIEREVLAGDRVTFWETCEYPDDSRVVVETTLEVREGKIVRQVDVVTRDVRADREEVSGHREAKGEVQRRGEQT